MRGITLPAVWSSALTPTRGGAERIWGPQAFAEVPAR